MTALVANIPPEKTLEPFYPSADGEPVAETYDHLYVMLTTLTTLNQYLAGQQATVLSNQFLYYAQGFPKLRVAPDVMVILGVAPGGRDNYKIWDEGRVPAVIFEMTSKSTQTQDQDSKKTLYEQLGVQEYWLFDPRGEWIPGQLRGYCLQDEVYVPVPEMRSAVLRLRLAVEGKIIGFYREDTGEKLLIPQELADALHQETQLRQAAELQLEQERQRAEQAELQLAQERQQNRQLLDQLRTLTPDQLRALGIDAETLP